MKFILKGLFLILVLGALAGGYYYYSQYTQYLQQSVQLAGETATFTVEKGSSIKRVARELEEQGIINPAMYFLALAKINKQENKIKAGEYELKAGMKPSDVLQLFTSGKALQYKLTIIEGKSYKDLVKLIKAHPHLKQTLTDDDYANIMQKIGSDYAHPEGAFWADTYNFPKNTTDLDFLKRSHKMLKEELQKAWDARTIEPSLKNPYEALVLASIVEKETGHESERPMIARVFINRLDINMMLQTDPTVIYGMGDAYQGNIRKKDLKRDTPYNTYTRNGLPPTPIAFPGKKAIEAVMHPPQGDALYFVAKGDGTSYFSKNYAEHRKAVIKYQLRGNAKRYQGDK